MGVEKTEKKEIEVIETKVLNLMHMARKAGNLQYGYDNCSYLCESGRAKLVIYAEDLMEKTKIKLDRLLDETGTNSKCFGTKALYGNAFNTRETGIVIITNVNFAKGINRLFV